VSVWHNAVWDFLRREGLRFKKNHVRTSNRRARTLPGGASAGERARQALTHQSSSSSTRPGSKQIWRPCAAGDQRASGCAPALRMVTGRP
jgi:hypothetical protein